MMGNLTIVMYHYVRDLARSRYPAIKGLDLALFEAQVAYLKGHYKPVSGYEVMDAVQGRTALPPRAVMLTFDDGYIDHFSQVFPVLQREGIPGCFFPPVKCITEHQVLDVNKIHFLLASGAEPGMLVRHIFAAIDANRASHGLRETADYWAERGKPSRYDTAEVMFVKYMLQRDLPLTLRARIIDELFREFVSDDEAAFSRDLYMDRDQIVQMQRAGMYVGSHGFEHVHLDSIGPAEQEREVDASLSFLEGIGADTSRWIMCYPYGAYNDSLLEILRARRCVAALTTKVGLANIGNPLSLSRLDTNDLPKDAGAAPNQWTLDAT